MTKKSLMTKKLLNFFIKAFNYKLWINYEFISQPVNQIKGL